MSPAAILPPALIIEDLTVDGVISPQPPANMSTTLADLLSTSLVLMQTAAYLPLSSRLALAATSKSFHRFIHNEPSAFQYVDLSSVKAAAIETCPMNKEGRGSKRKNAAFIEDEDYGIPILDAFRQLEDRQWLYNVSTLVLDGMAVPSGLVRSIITQDRFNVRMLSLREAKHLNHVKLRQVLNHSVRPDRPAGMPKLRGLYIFGQMEPVPVKEDFAIGRRRSPTRYPDSRPQDTVRAIGAQLGAEWNKKSQETLAAELTGTDDKWYQSAGKVVARTPGSEWADTLIACEGIIYFDAVLCRGPRHETPSSSSDTSSYLPPAVATIALGSAGCTKCGKCPEGPASFGHSPSHHLPLLAPPPFHGPSVRAAQMPPSGSSVPNPKLIVRCADCLRGRWCERCHKWWCESCYQPGSRTGEQQNVYYSSLLDGDETRVDDKVKVHMGLCIDSCLLDDLSPDDNFEDELAEEHEMLEQWLAEELYFSRH